MRITAIRAAGLYGATPPGGWNNELGPDDIVHTVVAVHTDGGVVGVGSCFTSDSLARAAIQQLEPLILGESALEPERLSEKMHRATFWLGRGGAVTHAISAVDLALWDILGKVTGQPVARLLGGHYRTRVRPYASVLMDSPDTLRAQLERLRERGWSAFKIGWGPFGRVDEDHDRKIVAAARRAVGDAAMLMVDAGASDSCWSHGYKWALRTSRMLEDYRVTWFEEPLRPDDIDDYVLLREHSPVSIAGGEVLTRRQSFLPWLERHALDIVQPDVTKVGGLSEQRRIAWYAHDHGVKFVPHGWNTALGLAADLHLAAASPDTDLVEYLPGSRYIDDLVLRPWTLDGEGMLAVPTGPGLGVEVDPEMLARFSTDPSLLTAPREPGRLVQV